MLTPANPVSRLKSRQLVFLNNCFGILFTNISLFQVCAEVEGAGKAVQRSKSRVRNSSSNSGMLVQEHSLIVNVLY